MIIAKPANIGVTIFPGGPNLMQLATGLPANINRALHRMLWN